MHWWLSLDGVIGTRSFLEQVHGMGRSQTKLQELYRRLVKFLDMTTPLLKEKLVEEAWGGNNLLRDLDYNAREYSVKEVNSVRPSTFSPHGQQMLFADCFASDKAQVCSRQ
jgi:hypothetical protein